MTTPPTIRIQDVAKRFGRNHVLRGADLDVEPGETHAVIGRSGEGKSVLLKLVCALLPYDAGRIEVEGHRVSMNDRKSIRHVRSRVSMVFQTAALFDSMTVRENVGFYLDERGEKKQGEIDEIVRRLLEEVHMAGTESLLPAELSGGMRKRIGLARALAAEPAIVLYDEPTTGLDPVTTDVINDMILQTKRLRGVTSIVVTHDMKSAYKVGDRISMLYEGRILMTGTPDQIRNTTNPYVRQFIEGVAEGPITDDDQAHLTASATQAGSEPKGSTEGRTP